MKKTDGMSECEIENVLRTLPEVLPDHGFQEQLGESLAKRHVELAKERRSKKNRGNIFRFGVVAAGLLISLIGAFTFYLVEKPSVYSTGPLFLATAQATGVPGITFGDSLDSMRLVKFNVQGVLPAGEQEGTILRLKNGIKTEKDVLEMAVAMGINEPEVSDKQPKVSDGQNEPVTNWVMVSGRKGRLSVWLSQGTWLYEQEADSSIKSSQLVSKEAAKDIAVQWLTAAGLLPQSEYVINQTPASETSFETVIKPARGPEGTAIVGEVPEIRVTVTEQGGVAHATGTWFEWDNSEKVQLSGYEQALEALKRGEGVFETKGYRPFTAGIAEIQKADTAYQLAYALDFTPYYVPVAVFQGEFTPEGGMKEPFTAFVSLLKNNQQENAGNFILDTLLPQVDKLSSVIAERGNEVTVAELPVLAQFFGVVGQPDASGGVSSEKGEITLTSWDGGWLYRSSLIGIKHSRTPVSDEVAVAAANNVVANIPALPGDLGQPFIRAGVGDDFKYVIYPIIYKDKYVFSTGGSGFESCIYVQVGPQGEIWSVQCTKPMVLLEDKQPLIRPEKAWDKLLKNNSLIYVEGFFGFIPGNRFAATYSKVTEVELIYKPRYTNMARNENYDIVYMFTGTARVGTKNVRFKAFVNAVES
ncbi:MAG: hypothetical protein A4E53_04553 [Pelotomaculum sp. PtaB.Bin104]|nr:MAG: hypothetical protein A4E53_04553 [Pelotomaculum sp. PtaB.Bin104]